jgi:hypothetical protein
MEQQVQLILEVEEVEVDLHQVLVEQVEQEDQV